MAENQIIELVREYLRQLASAGVRVDRAFLYGSYANGNSGNESDIDLLIVSESAENDSDRAAIIAWKLTRKTDTRIEPYLVSPKKFHENFSPLILAVKKNGIEIFYN